MAALDCWIELSPRPDWCVGLDARMGPSPCTIAEARSRYVALPNVRVTVVWTSATSTRAGVISEHGEVAWTTSPNDRIELSFSRPAKGSGLLQLVVRNPDRAPQSLAFASKYAPEYHAWLGTLAATLARVLSVPFDERDDGLDA